MPFSTDAIRLSARTLRKQPVFATVVILSLALAIAVNTTMYSVFDALAHPQLDMRNPDQLYWIRFYGDYKGVVDNAHRDAALATGMHSYSAITRASSGVGSGAATLIEHGANLVQGGLEGVGANYFDVLGPRVLAGRTFIPSDSTATSAPIVLGEDAATELFPHGASPIGAMVTVDRAPHTVVGVISGESDFPRSQTRAWVISPSSNRGTLQRLIRLRDGATPQQAAAELDVIAGRIAAEAGQSKRDVAFIFHKAADPEFQIRPLDDALILAVCAVLLVACANLANLQLARGIGRRRDLALRVALGATRGRIVRHLLTESVLLAGGGLAVGLLLTYLGGRALAASVPPSMGQYVMQPHLSWRVLLFALLATALCLVLVGLAPAIYVSRADPNELLKSGAGTGATKRNRRRYGVLVGIEIALALALSSAGALSVRTALATRDTHYGYDPSHLVLGLVPSPIKDGTVVRYSDVLQTLANRVKAVRGVTDAAAFGRRPVVNGAVSIDDAGTVREFPAPMYSVNVVSPSYLRTYGYRIVQGRDFYDGERDAAGVIIDEHTARILWPNANPIGQQIKFGDRASDLPYVPVVGVFAEAPQFASDSSVGVFMANVRSLGRIYYLPGPTDTIVVRHTFGAQFVARGEGKGSALALTLRRSFQQTGDVWAPILESMNDFLGVSRKQQSADFVSSLFTLFGALGVGLAAFGVYGVVAHSVAERRRELGVRIALGATAWDILHAVLRESVVIAIAGIAGGLLVVRFGQPLLGMLAKEDDVYNAPLFAAVAVCLLCAAAAAAMIPAMRATRVDPTESLRND